MALTRVFAYILLFIIKCRFPTGKSFADIIRRRYSQQVLTKVRKLEKADFKARKCKLDIEFLELCSAKGLTPKFLNFKVSNNLLRNSKAYRDCQVKFLKAEITNKKSLHRSKLKEFSTLKNELVRQLTMVDFTHVISTFANSNDKVLNKVQDTHRKKLLNLGYFEAGNGTNDPARVVHNFSSYQLDDIEKSLLAKGLNYALPPKFVNYADHMTPYELLFKDVKNHGILPEQLDILKVGMKNCAYNSFKRYRFVKELNLSKEEYTALKKLSSNKDIVISKSDKGNSVVIVNRDDYLKRMEDILSDHTKFVKLNVKDGKDYNFMVKEKSVVDSLLNKLHQKNRIDEKTKNSLTPNGPNPAKLYGLPKIHKKLVDGLPPYRPIISQIGSATYKLAKFLLPFITPVTTDEYTLKDSFEFASMIDKKDHKLFMASLDVDSLFTNVPLDETIDIITSQIYHEREKIQCISKQEFKEMLLLTTKGTVFYFNGMYYRQIDGVAMGSPLGPALANAFLCFHEQKWLSDCPLRFLPVFYARYVDDIFILLSSPDYLLDVVNYLNSKHNNINFTYEVEKDNCLAFLDISVLRKNEQFVTSIHRKATFSGVYTNYLSFIPSEYKDSLILTLLHRCYTISSSYTLIHEEIKSLKDILKNNGYPSNLIDKLVKKFFNKIFVKREAVSTCEKRTIRVILPFLGSTSLYVKKILKNLLEENRPIKLQVIFKNNSRMSSWFTFKDIVPKSLVSGIIYKYKCPRCNSGYLGCTVRYWEKRLEEHTHVSALTGKPLILYQIFSPMDHARKCHTGVVNRDDFTIVGKESNKQLLRLKESLLIHHFKPPLNINIESTKLHLFTA